MSTFNGLAVPLYSSTGKENISVASGGDLTFNSNLTLNGLSSSGSEAAVKIAVTSTGALADATVTTTNAFVVASTSKSVINSVIMYDSVNGGSAGVSSAVSFLAVNGTKAPSYFLKISGSAYGLGAAEANGFFSITKRMATSVVFGTSVSPFAALSVLAGTYVFYIPCLPNTLVA